MPPSYSNPPDITDRASLATLFQWFDQEVGTLDILVHAAGINVAKRTMLELEDEDWDRLIEINLTGRLQRLRLAMVCCMRSQAQGLVILINSVAGNVLPLWQALAITLPSSAYPLWA